MHAYLYCSFLFIFHHVDDEQKEMRKQKIIFNKLRRQGQMPPQDTYSSSPRDLDPTSTVTSDCRTSKLGSLKLQGLFRKRENSLSQGSSSPSSSPGSGKELLCPSWLESQVQKYCLFTQICLLKLLQRIAGYKIQINSFWRQ